jgi:spore coat polysaccharide biosynthesis protein SpsF
MGSTRLPGKVLMRIGNIPLIGHIIERLQKAGAKSDEIVFALTFEGNTEIENYLKSKNISFFNGDLYNVLSRFIEISKDLSDSDMVVRLTGDNPFIDFKCLNKVVSNFKSNLEMDYSYPYKLPVGMGFEVIRKKSLHRQLESDLKPHHLEHVTMFIKENPGLFHISPVLFFNDMPDIRLTVDYPEDLEMARAAWIHFAEKSNQDFCSEDILNLYHQNPDFFKINRNVVQKNPTEYEQKP